MFEPTLTAAGLLAEPYSPPLTIDQQILAALLRIEKLLTDDDEGPPSGLDVTDVITKITPTPTPFAKAKRK